MAKKAKKKIVKKKKLKLTPTDGLGPKEIKAIRMAVRQVWHRSHARKLCSNRSIGEDGFHYCELCKTKVPKIKIDHIEKVGDVDSGFIQRMFCSSSKLQALCNACHNEKTKLERKELKLKIA